MHRLTYPLGQRLLQMQFLVAEATFAYSTCQASIENWVVWFLSAHHPGLLSASGGDLMLSTAAGGCSSFGQEKDTLARKKTLCSENLGHHERKGKAKSWHRRRRQTFHPGSGIPAVHGTTWTQQCLFSSSLSQCQPIPHSEVPKTSVLGGFNFPSPATIRQCFPVRMEHKRPKLPAAVGLAPPGWRKSCFPCLPSTFGSAKPPGEPRGLWGPPWNGSPSCKWCPSPHYAKHGALMAWQLCPCEVGQAINRNNVRWRWTWLQAAKIPCNLMKFFLFLFFLIKWKPDF